MRPAGSAPWSRPEGKWILRSLLAYLAVCTASVFFSSHPELSWKGLFGKTFEYAWFFVIAMECTDGPKVTKRAVAAMIASGWLVCMYGLLQEWVLRSPSPVQILDPIRHRPLDYAKMVGPYNNPNNLATLLMVLTPIVIAVAFSRPFRSAIGLWGLAATLMICLALTESVGGFLDRKSVV